MVSYIPESRSLSEVLNTPLEELLQVKQDRFTTLEHLDVSNCEIGAKGVEELIKSLASSKTLHTLILD